MSADEFTIHAITRCPATLSREALELVFETLPNELRSAHIASLLDADIDKQPLDRLLVYRTESELVAALYVETQPGHVAAFWGPSIAASCSADHAQIAAALIHASCDHARQHGVQLAQVLLNDRSPALGDHYHQAGFSIRAELDYLICPLDEISPPANASGLRLAPYTADDQDTFAEIITKTYDGTYDCPELNGVRQLNHVLEGYADAGDSAQRHWSLVYCDDQIIGVLLLADHTAQQQAELVYMGVLPSVRGRGYGLALTQLAQHATRKLGHARLILAVDTRNRPALDLYTRAGFYRFDRRVALLQPLV